MASVKIATLVIRTIAKPIATSLKNQARQHEQFKELCISLAQRLHRSEMLLRYRLLGQTEHRTIRPLNERTAVENGANAIAEGFLFAVAATLILAETYRSARKDSKRRDKLDEQLEELNEGLISLTAALEEVKGQLSDERERSEQIARVLATLIESGLHQNLSSYLDAGVRVPALDAAQRAELDLPPASTRTPTAPLDGADSDSGLDSTAQ